MLFETAPYERRVRQGSDSGSSAGSETVPLELSECHKPSGTREFERGRRGRRFIQLQRDAKYRSVFPNFWDDEYCDGADFAFDIVIGRAAALSPAFSTGSCSGTCLVAGAECISVGNKTLF
jgi:hypothetical protein